MKLIPTIIQDFKTLEIYMLGYSNKISLEKTKQSGYVWLWSRSRKKLWMKGETSGNTLLVKRIFFDCDKDAVLVQVKLVRNATCHTGNKSCFFNKL